MKRKRPKEARAWTMARMKGHGAPWLCKWAVSLPSDHLLWARGEEWRPTRVVILTLAHYRELVKAKGRTKKHG